MYCQAIRPTKSTAPNMSGHLRVKRVSGAAEATELLAMTLRRQVQPFTLDPDAIQTRPAVLERSRAMHKPSPNSMNNYSTGLGWFWQLRYVPSRSQQLELGLPAEQCPISTAAAAGSQDMQNCEGVYLASSF